MSPDSHGLPGVLGEIAEIAGLNAALAVAAAVGGGRAYIARRPNAEHWLVQAVGPAVAAQIADHFTTGRTGVEIEFPLGPTGSFVKERARRAQQLADLTRQGLLTVKVARQVGVTDRAVRMFKARQRKKADDPQGDLGL